MRAREKTRERERARTHAKEREKEKERGTCMRAVRPLYVPPIPSTSCMCLCVSLSVCVHVCVYYVCARACVRVKVYRRCKSSQRCVWVCVCARLGASLRRVHPREDGGGYRQTRAMSQGYGCVFGRVV